VSQSNLARPTIDFTDIPSFRAAVVDLNGVWRGKRVPSNQLQNLVMDGARMPVSTSCGDIWGTDVQDNPLVFQSGDGDGFARPTGRGVLPCDWLSSPTALLPLWMWNEDGSPSSVDPRQVLAAVLARYAEAGLTPVTAMELEFYLVDASGKHPVPPRAPLTGLRLSGDGVLAMDELDEFEVFFADVYAACDACGVAADSAISENGAGQFEVNLAHGNDALKTADDANLFKWIVRGIARKHGFAASFMAKPYVDRAGSGLHTHFSMLDRDGNNVFNDGSDQGSATMRHAVSGLLRAMPESALIFAPHQNSYRRLISGGHAPTGVCWGYENRRVAVRIPGGSNNARRIEHRVAGADANPYLVLAAILGAALDGMAQGHEPVAPLSGDTRDQAMDRISTDWKHATERFANGLETRNIFSDLMREVFVLIKRQEQRGFDARMSAFEINSYLEVV